jgi:hypothetical protein
MLKEIFAVSGKSGLFKLVSKTKNMTIFESLVDQKRIPVYPHDKLMPLSEISIYTNEDTTPISTVFTALFEKEEGKNIPFDAANVQTEDLQAYFAEVVSNFDRERVYPSNIKKVLKWYDLLIANGFTDFSKKEDEETLTDDEKGESEMAASASTKHITSIPPQKVTKVKPTSKSTTPKKSVVGAKRGG